MNGWLGFFYRGNERWNVMLLAVSIVLRKFTVFAICFVQEATTSDFDDLGTLLLGGFGLAIVVAIAFAFVKLRLRDRKSLQSDYISINPSPKEK